MVIEEILDIELVGQKGSFESVEGDVLNISLVEEIVEILQLLLLGLKGFCMKKVLLILIEEIIDLQVGHILWIDNLVKGSSQ